MQAIVAATKSSAEVVAVEKSRGTLEAGKEADFLVLAENPLDDIGAFEHIREVYKGGRRVERKYL